MKKSLFCLAAAVIFAGGFVSIPAQQKEGATSLTATEQEKRTEEKHAKPILDDLKLSDVGKEAKLKEILAAHFKALNAWHDHNDAQIKALWGEFDKARSAKSDLGADAALEKIDGVYASFKPEHEKS